MILNDVVSFTVPKCNQTFSTIYSNGGPWMRRINLKDVHKSIQKKEESINLCPEKCIIPGGICYYLQKSMSKA